MAKRVDVLLARVAIRLHVVVDRARLDEAVLDRVLRIGVPGGVLFVAVFEVGVPLVSAARVVTDPAAWRVVGESR